MPSIMSNISSYHTVVHTLILGHGVEGQRHMTMRANQLPCGHCSNTFLTWGVPVLLLGNEMPVGQLAYSSTT